ncbi:hypothetical protein [Clostridium botulinum]|uniref:hypothetical protein n=1 Tax=Clostridium botulinum TaxID=1491 RepID=UPI000698A877|nr:hypothetical protein [Clostridium botulinum]
MVIKNRDNSDATVIDSKYVDFKGEKLTFNKWGQKVTGWSSIRIYDWVIIKGNNKTLHEMRQEKMLSLENEIEKKKIALYIRETSRWSNFNIPAGF